MDHHEARGLLGSFSGKEEHCRMMIETERAPIFTLIWFHKETEEHVRCSINYMNLISEEMSLFSSWKTWRPQVS